MEYNYAGVIFAVARSMLGLTITVKGLSAPQGITKISQLKFSQADLETIVEYFNANPMPELAFPANQSTHRVNLVIITEAMVRNAIEEFDDRIDETETSVLK